MTAPANLSQAPADRYRIEREQGVGGMGTVHLAHDMKHDRKIAIKVRPELAATHVAARHTIASRFGWSSSVGFRYLPVNGASPLKSLCDVVPSSEVSRGTPEVNS